MPLTKLKEIAQETWLQSGGGPEARGLCYYMCNFLESDKGIWSRPGTFNAATVSAQSFAQGTAMMNSAKAQMTRHAPQVFTNYAAVSGALTNNRIYRVGLWFGPIAAVAGVANHEMIVITGAGAQVAFYEPNFGFYEASNTGMNNRQAVEHFVNQMYGSTHHAGTFTYYNVRGINQAAPLGYTQ